MNLNHITFTTKRHFNQLIDINSNDSDGDCDVDDDRDRDCNNI